MTKLAISVGAVLVPGAAAAHPDHFSGGNFSLAHYLTDPFHVALACVAIFFIIAARRSTRRREPKAQ